MASKRKPAPGPAQSRSGNSEHDRDQTRYAVRLDPDVFVTFENERKRLGMTRAEYLAWLFRGRVLAPTDATNMVRDMRCPDCGQMTDLRAAFDSGFRAALENGWCKDDLEVQPDIDTGGYFASWMAQEMSPATEESRCPESSATTEGDPRG